MGIEVALALGLAAAGAGVNAYNTNKTLDRRDAAAADAIRNQGRLQREADTQVADQLAQLQGSSLEGDRAKRLAQFMETLTANRRGARGVDMGAELGSAAFRAANDAGSSAADQAALRTAGQLATIDAATMQRDREGQAYGRLATDLNLVQRKSAGQKWIDDLRAAAIRRNAGLDVLSGALSGAAGMVQPMGGGQPDIGPVVKERLVYGG